MFLFTSEFLKTLPKQPGVYQMFNAARQTLYVGKASNLQKRIRSYARQQCPRIKVLLQQVASIETIVTETEQNALLLEYELIKQLKPRYNICFRDDKSYPYLALSKHTDYPNLNLYRGKKTKQFYYFGPYPSVAALRSTLNQLQKLFKIRSCTDTFFRNRKRPCLQYQIGHCSAPCVGFVTVEDYQADVKRARLFLQGNDQVVIQQLVQHMEASAKAFEYERAAQYRDRIAYLRQIQQHRIHTPEGDLDVIALARAGEQDAIYVMNIRGGRLLGGRPYFPHVPLMTEPSDLLATFLLQFYLDGSEHTMPKTILISHRVSASVQATLNKQVGSVHLLARPKAKRLQWLTMALENARSALRIQQTQDAYLHQSFFDLQNQLHLVNKPQRLECFDVSHTQGESMVAACVVMSRSGFQKNDYRRFIIRDITPGDDYAALKQACLRHYALIKSEENPLPDVLIIDGGLGQLRQAHLALEELQITGITLLSIAKGPARKDGYETLWLHGKRQPLTLARDSCARKLIQRLRDEAHRFALSGHRQKRARTRSVSSLEGISGIGPKRRRELLRQFGGLQELQHASLDQIASVSGISKQLAKRIHAWFNKIPN